MGISSITSELQCSEGTLTFCTKRWGEAQPYPLPDQYTITTWPISKHHGEPRYIFETAWSYDGMIRSKASCRHFLLHLQTLWFVSPKRLLPTSHYQNITCTIGEWWAIFSSPIATAIQMLLRSTPYARFRADLHTLRWYKEVGEGTNLSASGSADSNMQKYMSLSAIADASLVQVATRSWKEGKKKAPQR